MQLQLTNVIFDFESIDVRLGLSTEPGGLEYLVLCAHDGNAHQDTAHFPDCVKYQFMSNRFGVTTRRRQYFLIDGHQHQTIVDRLLAMQVLVSTTSVVFNRNGAVSVYELSDEGLFIDDQ